MNSIQFIILCILLILVSYFVGFSMVSIIDNRLSKVSLNIPSQEHIIKLDNSHLEHFISNNNSLSSLSNSEEKQESEEKIDKSSDKTISVMNNLYDNNGLEGFDNYNNNQKNYVMNKSNDIRNKVDYNCNINSKDYGITNYSHPDNMNEVDKSLFINNYPPNMTLQDYINWLNCFKDKPNKQKLLNYIHLKHFQLLTNNKKLIYEEGVCPPPSNKENDLMNEDYFEKLYIANGINLSKMITDQEDNDIKGYNINDYSL